MDLNITQKVAFLFPIHPPKYKTFGPMLKTLAKNSIPVFLVFSNIEDKNKFDVFSTTSLNVLTDAYISIVANQQCVFPTVFKRIYGLKYVVENSDYNYIIAPDADVAPIEENLTNKNLAIKCDQYFRDKIAWGGPLSTKFFNTIWNSTVKTFPKSDQEKLNLLPQTFTWFSDAPIWERLTLTKFLEIYTPDRAATFDFFQCFDHMMYLFFLVLHFGFKFECVKDEPNGIELERDSKKIQKLMERGYRLNWVLWNLRNITDLTQSALKPFMFYHTDRF